ncbi:hypothetical protein COR50_19080 [Chitinophaga caeni]|uniref:Thioredoxin domain-containing protein n=1 Tax=Chitinophaga caeni TaxID=2029983 RepID=A0A291QZ27_9BACT|nr:thioredoxin family protein [Chitinophaga caeni]ATL49104.1 hypothetical protein COR50_19080 [Chitinophaga caeni]
MNFKKFSFLCALMLATICSFAQEKAHFEQGNFKAVLAQAKAANKPIFIDLYFEGCMPCKKMDQDVFTDPKVITYLNGNYICFKSDIFKEEDGKFLCQKFAVGGFPTFLLLSPDGHLINNFSGYTATDRLLPLLADAKEKAARKEVKKFDNKFNNKYPSFYHTRYFNMSDKSDKSEAIAAYEKQQKKYKPEVNFVVQGIFLQRLSEKTQEDFYNKAAQYAKDYSAEIAGRAMTFIAQKKAKKFAADKDKAGFDKMLAYIKTVYNERDWKIFGLPICEEFYKQYGDYQAFVDYVNSTPSYTLIDKAILVNKVLPGIKNNQQAIQSMLEWFKDEKAVSGISMVALPEVQYTISALNLKADNPWEAKKYALEASLIKAKHKAEWNADIINQYTAKLLNGEKDIEFKAVKISKPILMD